MNLAKKFVLAAVAALILGSAFASGQESGRAYRRVGIHNGNQVRTVFNNWGVIGQPGEYGPRGAWKNDNDGYLGDVSPLVGVEARWKDTTFHSVVTCPVSRPALNQDVSPSGQPWTFEPVGGYLNANQDKIAMSTNRLSWPPYWPDKLSDPTDPGWSGSWNGYFGKRASADLETYFVMDDQNFERFSDSVNNARRIQFRPDSRLPDRKGLGLEIRVRGLQWAQFLAQDLPLRVLYEDRDLLVLDKAAGMVVHPARGSPHSTVVNALLHRLAGGPDLPRLGLVHRLDKDTSGCLVVAKTEAALAALQAQWKGRTVEKVYLALCHGALAPEGRLDTPYGRHPRDRTRFTSRGQAARRAITDWRVLERFGAGASLAEVALHTGRTHQIRVHLAEAGHPLLGDTLYGGTRREARLPAESPVRRAAEAIGRQALHAARLAFDHPRTGKRVVFEAPLPTDLRRGLEILRRG